MSEILNFWNEYWILFGTVAFVYTNLFHREELSVDLGALGRFVTFLIGVTFVRIGIASLSPVEMTQFPSFVNPYSLLFVFLEDATYILPFILINKYVNVSKTFKLLYFIIVSFLFAQGHAAYGVTWMCITALYPYFISYKFSLKYGIATVMLSHLYYDFFTYLTHKLMPIFLLTLK